MSWQASLFDEEEGAGLSFDGLVRHDLNTGNEETYGAAPPTFTVQLTPGDNGVPTGTVVFKSDADGTLCSTPVDASGKAACTPTDVLSGGDGDDRVCHAVPAGRDRQLLLAA